MQWTSRRPTAGAGPEHEAPPATSHHHHHHHHSGGRDSWTWQDNCRATTAISDEVLDDDDDGRCDRGRRRHGIETLFTAPTSPLAGAGQGTGVTAGRLMFDCDWRIIDTTEE